MPSESSAAVKFEIGHVLFIDIVGYSKLLINEQSEQIQTLRDIVRGTEQFRLAEAQGKLVRLPTGDGGALVFRNSLEAPVLCAREISKALKSHPELHVRMGIHSGPVNEVTDLNEQANIAGAGINIAQRVMDCGDAGHILISRHVADHLKHYARWRPYLHEIGDCKVKHGEIISLVNFYTEELGNPKRPQNIRGAAPAKSVAVLPFVNLSADKHDEYLSDGMSEELINALARVPGLRVPGRTSCFAFKGKSEADIFRKVGDQLHVNTVLEGSVRKAGEKLRVTAQLINVSDGYHLWSDDYDGDINDILNFQSNVAERVVQALQIKLHGDETRVLAKKPTESPEAHRLYLLGRYEFGKYSEAGWTSSIRYYEQALKLDPNYALAYCGLADTYAYMGGVVMRSKEAVGKEKEFAQKALELDPELPEAHLSLACALGGAFIFAIALTHVFSSASQLLLARDRVRFSALLAVSMINAALRVIINWLGLWELQDIKHWSLAEVLLQLGWVVPNYFSCSLVAMPYSESGLLDMSAFFERQRRVIFSETLALSMMGGLATSSTATTFQAGSLTTGSVRSCLD